MALSKKIRSVRFVLAFWYSLIVLIAFTLFGGSVYLYLQHQLDKELEQNLVEEVDWIYRLIQVNSEGMIPSDVVPSLSQDAEQRIIEHFNTAPQNYIVLLTSTEGTILYKSGTNGQQFLLETNIPSDKTLLQSLQNSANGSLRVAARRVGPLIIQVAYSEDPTHSVMSHLLAIFGVIVPVVLFVAFSAGWLMSGMILRPISTISTMANRITAQNLSERIPARDVDDELGTLIHTMNGMIARLQASFEEMKQFSMNVAHELKTPLTILKGESELALNKSLAPQEAEDLATTYLEETVRMSRIVDDLLTLAKADAGQLTIAHDEIRIDELIQELYEDTVILSLKKNIAVELTGNQSATVLGDRSRLRQLFRALIMNAVHYTEPGGTIRIACSCTTSTVAVAIQDTGIGIPEESLPKIFQRFYRVDQARSRVSGGSGLGLSIAKWIVESHNGAIAVQSSVGKGSTFTVTLPLLRSHSSK